MESQADAHLVLEIHIHLEGWCTLARCMNADRKDFLRLVGMPPARLGVEETAWYLGFAAHDIPILVKAGLLKPLGKPGPNAVKYFATAVLAQLRGDAHWLGRASDAVMRHWQTKNARRTVGNGRHASRVDATRVGGA